ncbi:signal recognition particle, SRP9/SRP14 subunit [Atractiella rhizophila]|nr:signal recognition particle, SRP9/SRP14 subunit [Atractiella rhizophila]
MSLPNAEFLTRLGELFSSTRTRRSVFLTYKRYTYVKPDTEGDVEMEKGDGDGEKRYSTLIRAADGDKIKFSTLVQPTELTTFHSSLSSILKSSMSSLRKKPKDKSKKAAGPGGGAGLAKVIGPRRGKGREKRRRLIRARERAIGKKSSAH